jgi:pyruvate kinase
MMLSEIDVAITIGITLSKGKLPLTALHDVSMARLNFSHVNPEETSRFITVMREYSPNLKIWQDLQGPKIRVGDMGNTVIKVSEGQTVSWCSNELNESLLEKSNKRKIPISLPAPFAAFQNVNEFSMKDGSCNFRITENNSASKGFFKASPENEIVIRTGKSINAPELQDPSFFKLTEKDKQDLVWGLNHGVDIISLSYVNDERVVKEALEFIMKRTPKSKLKIWAKIETRNGCENFESIIKLVDGVVLGRGDLVPEIGISEASLAQYNVLQKFTETAWNKRKDFIIATHVLGSMQYSSAPRITEINDITNSIRAGATGFLLGIEVSAGKYPMEAIESMNSHLAFLQKAKI